MAALKRVLGAIIGVLSWLEDLGIFLLSLLVFLIGLYALLDSALVYRKANDPSLLVFKPDYSQSETVKAPQDMAAWLSFADVDLPVMQGEDNQEYLNKDPYGDYSLAGSLFLDARNQKDFSDPYSLIYGHHMEGNSMFGSLHNFLQVSDLSLNRFGVLWVDGTPFPLVAFAALEVDATNPYIFAPTEVDVSDVLGFAKEQAVVWLPTLQMEAMDEEEEQGEADAQVLAEGEVQEEVLAQERTEVWSGENTMVEEEGLAMADAGVLAEGEAQREDERERLERWQRSRCSVRRNRTYRRYSWLGSVGGTVRRLKTVLGVQALRRLPLW